MSDELLTTNSLPMKAWLGRAGLLYCMRYLSYLRCSGRYSFSKIWLYGVSEGMQGNTIAAARGKRGINLRWSLLCNGIRCAVSELVEELHIECTSESHGPSRIHNWRVRVKVTFSKKTVFITRWHRTVIVDKYLY